MTPATPAMPAQAGQQKRRLLLNLKCLFWCLHERGGSYDANLVMHSLERAYLHPDLARSHLGDNIEYLMASLSAEDQRHVQDALGRAGHSRSAVEVEGKRFEIGHYVQTLRSFGAIAEDSHGVISAVTPRLRGLFYLDGGRLMEESFAPSDVRVIYGTYVA